MKKLTLLSVAVALSAEILYANPIVKQEKEKAKTEKKEEKKADNKEVKKVPTKKKEEKKTDKPAK